MLLKSLPEQADKLSGGPSTWTGSEDVSKATSEKVQALRGH